MDYIYIACGNNVEEVPFVDSLSANKFVESHADAGYDCVVERPIKNVARISFNTMMITCVNGDTYMFN